MDDAPADARPAIHGTTEIMRAIAARAPIAETT